MANYNKNASVSGMLINIIFILLSLCCIVPLLLVISISVSSQSSILNYGFRLIPHGFSGVAYRLIFENPDQIFNAYKTTIIITVVGTFINVLICAMFAYPVSRTDFAARRSFSFYLYFTALFSGGLVPFYILMTQYLHLQNTYLALILPSLGSVWYIFMLRTFFQELPKSIMESAVIDGAGDIRVFFSFVLPLSKPVIATITLFTTLGYWNEWYNAMLFITKDSMYPLQYLLQTLLLDVQFLQSHMENMPSGMLNSMDMPTDALRMAMVIIAAGPMLVVFPFFQKYFVRGMSLGAVKG